MFSSRRKCINSYIKATSYPQSHLPINVKLIKYAQYLHPEKRKEPGATNAMSHLALTLASVTENKLANVFEIIIHSHGCFIQVRKY